MCGLTGIFDCQRRRKAARDILTKVDGARMAHGLAVRVPLLDHPLVEWLCGLSPGLKRRGTDGKYVTGGGEAA